MRTFSVGVAACGLGGLAAASGSGLGLLPPPIGEWMGGASLAALSAWIALASARPDLQWLGPSLCRTRHPGRLALSFDDGPDPRSTPALLRTLTDAGATATFFVLADRAVRHPALLRDMVAAGQEVALHGLHHDFLLTLLPPPRGAAVLRKAVAMLRDLGTPEIHWFRPPFGAVSPRLYAAADLAGLPIAWCSVRTGDGGWASPAQIRARCRRAAATDIVLLHEGAGPATVLLPELLQDWAARGLAVSSISAAMEA